MAFGRRERNPRRSVEWDSFLWWLAGPTGLTLVSCFGVICHGDTATLQGKPNLKTCLRLRRGHFRVALALTQRFLSRHGHLFSFFPSMQFRFFHFYYFRADSNIRHSPSNGAVFGNGGRNLSVYPHHTSSRRVQTAQELVLRVISLYREQTSLQQ